MISADDLIALVQNYNPKTDTDLIQRAYDYGNRMHEGQQRHSGEPYFTHPVAVAAILTEQQLDDATIVTALLHDTIEDTRSTFGEVEEIFCVKLEDLVAMERSEPNERFRSHIPEYPVSSTKRIWGLTAVITRPILHKLLKPVFLNGRSTQSRL